MLARATKKTVSRKTVLNVLGTLSTILTTARNWGYNCEQINLDKLRLQARGMKYEAPSFTPDQLKRILAIAEEPWRTMFCILTLDGLRAGEVLGLKWCDIDFDRSLLHIRRTAWYGKIQTAKSEASETILPHSELAAHDAQELSGHLEAQRGGLPFCDTKWAAPIFQQSRGISPVDDPRRAGDPAVRSSRISPRTYIATP